MKLQFKIKRMTGIQKRWFFNNVSILVSIVVLAVVAFSVAISAYYYSSIQTGLEAKAKTTTDFFGDYISQSYNEYYQSCITFARTFEEKNSMELQFVNTEGKLVASSYGQWSGVKIETSEIQNAVLTKQIAVFTGKNPATNEKIMAVSSPMIYSNGEVIGVLRFVTSLHEVDRQILWFVLLATFVGLAIISVVVFSSVYFIRSIVGPVREVTMTAKRIAAGSYGVQIQKKFDDEIGELADTINDMSMKIAQSEKMQTEFVSSVSHELRTPLTAISGWSETLQAADELDPMMVRRGVLFIQREAKRLTSMVEELLEFTSMQDGRFKLNVQMNDIRSEFEDAVFMYANQLAQEEMELLYLDNDDDIPEIACDAYRMRQVFLNILDNAAKHGGEGKKITAEIRLEAPWVVIRIRDFGPGIPEEELPHIKMKFYKGSSKARGSGIGLAVCDEIVSMHQGELTLENAHGGGTLVTIRLPISET